jgi:hypothetical protein
MISWVGSRLLAMLSFQTRTVQIHPRLFLLVPIGWLLNSISPSNTLNSQNFKYFNSIGSLTTVPMS